MTRKILNLVTITGADDKTDPKELERISKEFPFVEWGILASSSNSGCSRFPSREWFKTIVPGLNYSLHLCGRYVRDSLAGTWSFAQENELGEFLPVFQRVQVNFHAMQAWHNDDYYKSFSKAAPGLKMILQMDGVNDGLASKIPESDLLFDLSGGAGVLPNRWPEQLNGRYCGYAGGLSPENLQMQLEKISTVAQPPTWIDVESHVRTGWDFDLAKCHRFLEVASPWVI